MENIQQTNLFALSHELIICICEHLKYIGDVTKFSITNKLLYNIIWKESFYGEIKDICIRGNYLIDSDDTADVRYKKIITFVLSGPSEFALSEPPNKTKLVRLLVKHPILVGQCKELFSPVYMYGDLIKDVCVYGDYNIMKTLFIFYKEYFLSEEDVNAYFTKACTKGNLAVVEWFVDNFDFIAQDMESAQSFILACDRGYLNIIEFILKKWPSIKKNMMHSNIIEKIIDTICNNWRDDPHIIELFLKYFPNVGIEKYIHDHLIVIYMLSGGNNRCAQYICSIYPELFNDITDTNIHYLVTQKDLNPETLDFLVEHCPNFNAYFSHLSSPKKNLFMYVCEILVHHKYAKKHKYAYAQEIPIIIEKKIDVLNKLLKKCPEIVHAPYYVSTVLSMCQKKYISNRPAGANIIRLLIGSAPKESVQNLSLGIIDILGKNIGMVEILFEIFCYLENEKNPAYTFLTSTYCEDILSIIFRNACLQGKLHIIESVYKYCPRVIISLHKSLNPCDFVKDEKSIFIIDWFRSHFRELIDSNILNIFLRSFAVNKTGDLIAYLYTLYEKEISELINFQSFFNLMCKKGNYVIVLWILYSMRYDVTLSCDNIADLFDKIKFSTPSDFHTAYSLQKIHKCSCIANIYHKRLFLSKLNYLPVFRWWLFSEFKISSTQLGA